MIEVLVPRESVNDQSVVVQRVLLADGAEAQADQVVVEIETSKTVIEVAAPVAGTVRHRLVAGTEMPVGAPLFSVGAAMAALEAAVAAPVSAEAPAEGGSVTPAITEPPLLSRAAAAAAARLGTDLSRFQGRWVTEADVLGGGAVGDAAAPQPAVPLRAAAPAPAAAAAADRPALAHDEVVQNMRKRAEVDSLLKGQHAATTSTIGIRIALPGERLVAPDFLFKDSIADLLIFEGARLLRQYPELNGFNIDARTAGQYQAVNFGVSFDNHRNLKVLSLRGADTLGLPEIQRQYGELLDLYESNRPLPVELMSTATVTLSDLSVTSASFMLPLINGQQALILGVVRHHQRLFELFASFDHRVSEGLRVTRFLESLRERVVSHYRSGDGVVRLHCDACGKSMHDELRLGGRGFVNITRGDGETGHLCRNCFEGR